MVRRFLSTTAEPYPESVALSWSIDSSSSLPMLTIRFSIAQNTRVRRSASLSHGCFRGLPGARCFLLFRGFSFNRTFMISPTARDHICRGSYPRGPPVLLTDDARSQRTVFQSPHIDALRHGECHQDTLLDKASRTQRRATFRHSASIHRQIDIRFDSYEAPAPPAALPLILPLCREALAVSQPSDRSTLITWRRFNFSNSREKP